MPHAESGFTILRYSTAYYAYIHPLHNRGDRGGNISFSPDIIPHLSV